MLKLQSKIVYGPVNSRRLGASLGINLLPVDRKVCTFDCLYCQYGWTDTRQIEDAEFPTVKQVQSAVEKTLAGMGHPPAYITFSGNGEPTLHPDFPEIVEIISALRDRYAPKARTAVLSNATTLHDPEICQALAILDARIMKLDAGTETTLRRFNQPRGPVDLKDLVGRLAAMKNITLQSLFAKGTGGNFAPDHIERWIGQLKIIRPVAIQIYTLDRDYPSGAIEKLTGGELQGIFNRLQSESLPVQVFE